MTIQLRTFRPEDIDKITTVKRLAWPDEECDAAQVKTALTAPRHQTYVIEVEGELVGFVDGFLTYGESDEPRWEVDLLAVHPEYHGRGLGSQLISANTRAGIEAGATMVRSLIHVDNHASESAFARNGYKSQSRAHQLMVLTRDRATTRIWDTRRRLGTNAKKRGGLLLSDYGSRWSSSKNRWQNCKNK